MKAKSDLKCFDKLKNNKTLGKKARKKEVDSMDGASPDRLTITKQKFL